MRMRWEQLLFAHWPINTEILLPKIPPGLELDLWQGQAWIAVVPFLMKDVSPRGAPHVPFLADFAEINVRAYVKAQDKPGVWFFSLDATSRIAVNMARRTFHLPYHHAEIQIGHQKEMIDYRSTRSVGDARFVARYKPASTVYRSERGSFDEWITERYCLYAQKPDGTLLRGEVHHAPWPLQRAAGEIETNTMCLADGIELPQVSPVLHYAERLDVIAWWPESF